MRDATAGSPSLTQFVITPMSMASESETPVEAAPLWVVVLVAVILLGISVGLGVFRRTVGDLHVARIETVVHKNNEGRLNYEVERQNEREQLVREVHDTLASRLSLLSLHSGALEVAASKADPDVVEAARVVRSSAHQSLDDLRHLVGLLRSPAVGTTEGGTLPIPTPTLTDLPTLIDEARDGGSLINANIFLYDAAHCGPKLGHAIYRIIQESLANARKHAYGSPINLDVRGGPGTGLTVQVSNPVALDAEPFQQGSNSGLQGMRERAQLLGGRVDATVSVARIFTVSAWLPWSTDEEPAAG